MGHATTVLGSAITILGVGATARCSPSTCRLSRDCFSESGDTEVQQYAKVQFLERELFATPGRTAILLLVSVLERRIVILPDTGLHARVSTAEWDAVIVRMTQALRTGGIGAALLDGLAGVSELLASKGFTRATAAGVFANAPIEAKGA